MAIDVHAVSLVISDQVASAWRAPDAAHPRGCSFGLRLSRVVDSDRALARVAEGDHLTVRHEGTPERIVLARVVKHEDAPARALMHA